MAGRAPRVEIQGGDGFDLLVSAVAVADHDWRAVLAHGPEVWSTVRHDLGADLTRAVGRFGRFGWINLAGLLAAEAGGRGARAQLVDLVGRTPAKQLRFVVARGMRRQSATVRSTEVIGTEPQLYDQANLDVAVSTDAVWVSSFAENAVHRLPRA